MEQTDVASLITLINLFFFVLFFLTHKTIQNKKDENNKGIHVQRRPGYFI